MVEDILEKARKMIGSEAGVQPQGYLSDATGAARRVLDLKPGLDAYIVFDTTGSMSYYRQAVSADLRSVTGELLGKEPGFRLSMNGIGDHGDGEDWLQMYALSSDPAFVQRSLDSIVDTSGGDEPEAYECLALSLAQRIPKDSAGRKRAVILVADSVPHGMVDAECDRAGSYVRAFAAMKTVCDGFYFVSCGSNAYNLQQQLIDFSKPDKEQIIALNDMVGVLPQLLIALAKKADSEKTLGDYMQRLEHQDSARAQQIRGLLGSAHGK